MFGRRLVAVLVAAFCGLLCVPSLAQAFGTAQPAVVDDVPSRATPNVLDGRVQAITQVGNTTILGGSFTQVANPGGTDAVTGANGQYIVAFDATTGTVNTAFAPGLDGQVWALLPGPVPDTVYVGGAFNNVGGVKDKGLTLLDVTTGHRVPGFAAIAMNGTVQALERVGDRLFVGGTFTSFGGQARGGLASVDATTGAVDGFVQTVVQLNHNWTSGQPVCGTTYPAGCSAKGAVGVTGMDITPDGTRMVIIGDFKTVDGLPRDQIAMLDLTGAQAVVRTDWATHGYEAACYSWAYDSYIRDVQFSPDGTYFVVAATGGGNNTLCDAAARFETGGTGTDVKPSWVNWSGGDSYLSVAVTSTVVYVGGHQRWMNNTLGNDWAAGGAVPRPGIGALDPSNGEPLTWNPGRNPRGAGAWTLLATPNGLYVGSDTDWVGNYKYRRMKIAYFPLAGGTAPAATTTPDLPGNVYLGGAPAPSVDPSSVLYRINAAGPALTSTDAGPGWAADTAGTSPYRTGNSSYIANYGSIRTDATVPDGTPSAVFDTERWDFGTKGDGDEMRWAFPVPAGQQVTVRLYFANQCSCTASVGQRQFDVAIDGSTVLDHFDPVAAAGGPYIGTMRAFPITSDGTVNIDFTHEVEHPLINGIEIVKTTTTPPPATTGLSSRAYDGHTAGAAQAVPTDLDWNTVRAPVLIGSWLYYAKTDGQFYRRTFDGTTFGPENVVDPYNDPTWSDVSTGNDKLDADGNKVPAVYYRGTVPDFYGQLTHLTSAFYSDGRLYYTVSGSSSLYYRGFSPDSGIVNPVASTVAGVSLPQVDGAFIGGGYLYYVDASSGVLDRVGFAAGTVPAPATLSGAPTAVSGPAVDGVDWRARSVFLGPAAHTDAAPIASASVQCTGLSCSFDGSGSSDSDGSVTGYHWSFGDGATAEGVTATHTYASAGSFPVVLTVTDDKGAASSTTTSATVAPIANQAPSAQATASCTQLACSFDASGSSDPDGQVSGYAWDFGDDATGTGRTLVHSYAGPGNYQVTLTVTDDKGATATSQVTVSPTAATTGIGFRGASDTAVAATSATVTVPASVQPGDLLVLDVGAAGSATQTLPAGWTQVASIAPWPVLTTVWQHTATAGEAGSPVTVTFGAQQKATLALLAYSDAGPISPAAAATATDATSAGSHEQPTVTAAVAGSRALWFWNVKSSSTRTLSVPDGTVGRDAASGSGSAYVTTLAAESAQSVSGAVAGPTSVADGTTTMGRTTMVALVIPPAQSSPAPTVNTPPTATATAACTGLACSFDGSTSTDPDGHLVAYAWDFGDGATATGATATHSYAGAGNEVVTLTVTDDRGATGSYQLVVSPAPPSAGIEFRGASGTSAFATTATVQVPATVQPGDLLVLSVSAAGTATQTPPNGWTQVAAIAPSGALSTVWQRAAVAGDAGSPVTVTFDGKPKSDVSVFAYAGAALADPAAAATATDAYSAGSHTQPTVTAAVAGSRVLWIWNVKSSATTSMSLPDGTVVRYSSRGSGTGYVTTLAVESAQPVSGDVPGPTSVADGVTMGRTTMIAVVLAPKS